MRPHLQHIGEEAGRLLFGELPGAVVGIVVCVFSKSSATVRPSVNLVRRVLIGAIVRQQTMPSQVHDTLVPPFQWVCSVHAVFNHDVLKDPNDQDPGAGRFGTGLLITPRHVLTCAHNLTGIRSIRGKWLMENAADVSVKVGRNDDGRSASPLWFRARDWHSHPRYRNGTGHPDTEFDYAIIELKAAVGNRTFLKSGRRQKVGWWSAASDSYIRPVEGSFKSALRKKKVNVYGYPGSADTDSDERSTPVGIPMIDFDSVILVEPREGGSSRPLLVYRNHTSEGQSGGPVWVVDRVTGKRYLVAVHAGGQRSDGAGVGVLLTQDVVDQLGRWGVGSRLLSISSVTSVQ